MACTARGCDARASRAAEVVSASHSVCVLMVQVASRLMVSQWPMTRAPQKHFDVCVLPCVSMCGGGESHTRAACVSSVFWTRERVCRAQRGERGRGSGEAEAVAKLGATCLSARDFAVRQKGKIAPRASAKADIIIIARPVLRRLVAPPRCAALGRAALGRAALSRAALSRAALSCADHRHGAQAIHSRGKTKEAEQSAGKNASANAAFRK